MDILTFGLLEDKLKKVIKQKCDLNLSQTRLLLYFNTSDNKKISMGQLAQELNISLSTLSRQINQPKTFELIELERSKSDSSKLLRLNDDGLHKAQILANLLEEIQLKLIEEWGEEELGHFQKNLNAVLVTLSKVES